MAKNTDHLAGGLDTDNTGGVLSGLLAEEDDLDRRALWRIGSWGVGAVAAVILAVMANQSSLGLKRDQRELYRAIRQQLDDPPQRDGDLTGHIGLIVALLVAAGLAGQHHPFAGTIDFDAVRKAARL